MEIGDLQIGQNFAVSDSERGRIHKIEPGADAAHSRGAGAQNGLSVSAQVNAQEADKKESQAKDLNEALQDVEDFLQVQNRNLAFSVDEQTKRAVVTVKDAHSGDIIRQIPSEEVLRLAERIKDLQQDVDSSVGILFDNRV